MTKKDIETESRLTRIETQISDIVGNHLPHLEAKLDRLQWLIISTLVAVITGIAVRALS